MKKILVCLIGIMFVLPSFADDNNCGINKVVVSGPQRKHHNEFLYENEAVFNEVPGKKGEHIVTSGRVWECDNEYCSDGKEVTLKAGHVFEGVPVKEEKSYICLSNSMDDDRWVEQHCGETYISFSGQNADHNEFLYENKDAYQEAKQAKQDGYYSKDKLSGKVYECDNKHCNDDTVLIMPANHYFNGVLQPESKKYICRVGFGDGWKLVEEYAEEQDIETPDDKPTCKETRKEEVGKACCDIPASKARYDEKENTCTCYGSFDFKHDGERGWCEPKKTDDTNEIVCPDGSESGSLTCSGETHVECTFWNGNTCECAKCVNDWKETEVVEQFSCSAHIISQITQWNDECSDVTKYENILNAINQIHMYCGQSNGSYQELKDLYDELVSLNPYQCAVSTHIVISQATQKINEAVDSLRSYVSDLEVSKWKTADGKFNTARLASDSIAGVVLGTAGGLITSNVVKKHQVEDGFEDLQCVIGGQTVAGWGDEFTVGVH